MYLQVTNLESELIPTIAGVGEEITVSTAVKTAAALPSNATQAWVGVKSQPVLVTFDGTSPAVGGAGVYLAAGYNGIWSKELLAAAKFIRQGGTNATVRIEPLTRRG